uniref:Protein Flattop n=1 Tax=Takifugu rubripes TaxID=31033 RepID=A0A3B5KK47_TAKRU
MSSNYSANQVTNRPAARSGHTTFISDDRGHLLPGAEKVPNAWPDFKGTWALPSRIPACHINPTSRSVDGLQQLRSLGLYPQLTGNNHPLQPDGRSVVFVQLVPLKPAVLERPDRLELSTAFSCGGGNNLMADLDLTRLQQVSSLRPRFYDYTGEYCWNVQDRSPEVSFLYGI